MEKGTNLKNYIFLGLLIILSSFSYADTADIYKNVIQNEHDKSIAYSFFNGEIFTYEINDIKRDFHSSLVIEELVAERLYNGYKKQLFLTIDSSSLLLVYKFAMSQTSYLYKVNLNENYIPISTVKIAELNDADDIRFSKLQNKLYLLHNGSIQQYSIDLRANTATFEYEYESVEQESYNKFIVHPDGSLINVHTGKIHYFNDNQLSEAVDVDYFENINAGIAENSNPIIFDAHHNGYFITREPLQPFYLMKLDWQSQTLRRISELSNSAYGIDGISQDGRFLFVENGWYFDLADNTIKATPQLGWFEHISYFTPIVVENSIWFGPLNVEIETGELNEDVFQSPIEYFPPNKIYGEDTIPWTNSFISKSPNGLGFYGLDENKEVLLKNTLTPTYNGKWLKVHTVTPIDDEHFSVLSLETETRTFVFQIYNEKLQLLSEQFLDNITSGRFGYFHLAKAKQFLFVQAGNYYILQYEKDSNILSFENVTALNEYFESINMSSNVSFGDNFQAFKNGFVFPIIPPYDPTSQPVDYFEWHYITFENGNINLVQKWQLSRLNTQLRSFVVSPDKERLFIHYILTELDDEENESSRYLNGELAIDGSTKSYTKEIPPLEYVSPYNNYAWGRYGGKQAKGIYDHEKGFQHMYPKSQVGSFICNIGDYFIYRTRAGKVVSIYTPIDIITFPELNAPKDISQGETLLVEFSELFMNVSEFNRVEFSAGWVEPLLVSDPITHALDAHFAYKYNDKLPFMVTAESEHWISDFYLDIKVRYKNVPPIAREINDQAISIGDEYTIYLGNLFANDGLGEESYTFTVTGLPEGLTLVDKVNIGGAPTEAGTFQVTVNATDSYGASTDNKFTMKIKGDKEEGGVMFNLLLLLLLIYPLKKRNH